MKEPVEREKSAERERSAKKLLDVIEILKKEDGWKKVIKHNIDHYSYETMEYLGMNEKLNFK